MAVGNDSLLDDDTVPQLVDTESKATQDEETRKDSKAGRVPITIVTGYLGAGKTTLLNYILSAQHGKKIAVILNEFGDSADIEKSMTINSGNEQIEEWLDVGNGCICCSVKDQGINAIEALMDRRGLFDYILLETTGLANPGNLAPLFWVDEGLGSTIYLDGVVTLVDAKNLLKSLDEPSEVERAAGEENGVHMDIPSTSTDHVLTTAHLQISHADVIVVNKSDLVTAEELEAVKDRITSINGLARMIITERGVVPDLKGFLLDLHAYDAVGASDLEAKNTASGQGRHDKTITTHSFVLPPVHPDTVGALDAWLRSVLWENQLPLAHVATAGLTTTEFDIHRLKARLPLTDGSTKIVQGVREVFEIIDAPNDQDEDISGSGKLVLIGRGLEDKDWRASFMTTVFGEK